MGKEKVVARGRPTADSGPARSKYGAFTATIALTLLVAGCGAPTPKAELAKTSEYFAESEYGVKASPRVAWGVSNLPRGGGRYQVGRPYQIKGRWYRPKEDPDYVAEGKASWYGEAFHGRLTANGEVYDMTHLTAAHPTIPLPSYARVTNLSNGSSVIVRVNDRGPFAHNRIIDLSKRAADMLDYRHAGVANVRVEYVGPAPLHGQDDRYLLASYRPGNAAPDPSDGLPTGVMVAMNGPTPSRSVPGAAVAFADQPRLDASGGTVALPTVGPIVPDRPTGAPVPAATVELALLSYADRRVSAAAEAFDAVLDPRLDGARIKVWWEQRNGGEERVGLSAPYVNLGTWTTRAEAERIAHALSDLGRPVLTEAEGPDGRFHVASLAPDGTAGLDEMLRAAWAAGAVDAFAVRE